MIVRRHRRREIDENRQDGVLFLVGSLAVVALLHLLTRLFPDTWGGQNILTGLLILGGYFGMAIGTGPSAGLASTMTPAPEEEAPTVTVCSSSEQDELRR